MNELDSALLHASIYQYFQWLASRHLYFDRLASMDDPDKEPSLNSKKGSKKGRKKSSDGSNGGHGNGHGKEEGTLKSTSTSASNPFLDVLDILKQTFPDDQVDQFPVPDVLDTPPLALYPPYLRELQGAKRPGDASALDAAKKAAKKAKKEATAMAMEALKPAPDPPLPEGPISPEEARSRALAAANATEEPLTNTSLKVANRMDVPEEIKAVVATLRKQVSAQKKKERSTVKRLQKQVDNWREKAQKRFNPGAVLGKTEAEMRAELLSRTPPPSWESRYNELVEFHKGYGHCRVTRRTPGLGRWVLEMRRNYQKAFEKYDLLGQPLPEDITAGCGTTELTAERVDLLKKLNFDFRVAEPAVPWERRFEDLKAFKRENGHCRVPKGYAGDPALAKWVQTQRKHYKSKAPCLIGERTEKLKEIGFEFEVFKSVSWEERFEQLVEFRRKNGNLNVPAPSASLARRAGDDSEDESDSEEGPGGHFSDAAQENAFRRWVMRQKSEYVKSYLQGKKCCLDHLRVKKLESIGFSFDAYQHSAAAAAAAAATAAAAAAGPPSPQSPPSPPPPEPRPIRLLDDPRQTLAAAAAAVHHMPRFSNLGFYKI